MKIGLEDPKIGIKHLINQKKERLIDAKKDWITLEDEGNTCIIKTNKQEKENICIVLSDIIIENLEVRYLVNILKNEYKFLTEKEQCEILVLSLKSVWDPTKQSQDIDKAKKDVSNRIMQVLENSDELILEGFMRFRMKDYLLSWRDSLKRTIDSYLLNKEYDEFINVVKYFVMIKKSKYEKINVFITSDNTFAIFDENMVLIDDSKNVSDQTFRTYDMKYKDILLSLLVNIAPKHITIHHPNNLNDDVFIKTLNKIFDNQVFLVE
jgi:putative sporulation protein YtxC